MNRLVSWVKNLRPLKFLVVSFLSLSLFFVQAANSLAATTKPNAGEKSEYYTPKDVLSPYEGGMNNFSDVDPRSKDAETEAKARAQALKSQAEYNHTKASSNIVENARRIANDSDKIGQNIGRKADSVKDKLQEEAENFGDSTKKGLRNIKNNTQDAADYASDTAEKTVGNPIEGIKQGVKDETYSVKRNLKEAQ